MQRFSTTRRHAEVSENFDDSQWGKADVEPEWGPLSPGESAVYRATFEAGDTDLAKESIALECGMIDDEGWVYVNGQAAGEAHDWNSQPSFEILPFLHKGGNSIAVTVRNREGPGGLCRGVKLQVQDQAHPVQWQRSAFNGLAEVIVQAGRDSGTLHLTAKADGLAEGSLDILTAENSPRKYQP